MTEHTRESDEQLLIDFVLEIAGIEHKYLVDAANRLKEKVDQEEKVYCECNGEPTLEEVKALKCSRCGGAFI